MSSSPQMKAAYRRLASGPTMVLVRPGTRVEVRRRFDDKWTRGFEIAGCDDSNGRPRYKVRRRSDGSILPVEFGEQDLREERRRGTWWI